MSKKVKIGVLGAGLLAIRKLRQAPAPCMCKKVERICSVSGVAANPLTDPAPSVRLKVVRYPYFDPSPLEKRCVRVLLEQLRGWIHFETGWERYGCFPN